VKLLYTVEAQDLPAAWAALEILGLWAVLEGMDGGYVKLAVGSELYDLRAMEAKEREFLEMYGAVAVLEEGAYP
jgi:hypothetical protein